MIFVLENSHFGHLKTCFSAPFAIGSLLASSIRVRHIAQRGGLMVSGSGATGMSGDGMAIQMKSDACYSSLRGA